MKKELEELRQLMKLNNADFYIIATDDFHQSEYVADYFKARAFISGFTGSAGTLVVTRDFAGLWTDSRYFLQAEQQLSGSGIELMKDMGSYESSYKAFIEKIVKSGQIVAFDARTLSAANALEIQKKAKAKGAQIKNMDLVAKIWVNRPGLPEDPVYVLDESITGESTASKLSYIRKQMEEKSADIHVISALDEIAYILNMRGTDITYNPVFLSYLVIGKDFAELYIDRGKLSPSVKEYLKAQNIELRNYFDIDVDLKAVHENAHVLFDSSKLNYNLYLKINPLAVKIDSKNPAELKKACKNDVELKKTKYYHKIDGVAMIKFIKWLFDNYKTIEITELDVEQKLEEIRSHGEGYKDLSFATIAGFAGHGAIVHYKADEKSSALLKEGNVLLLDSGAQYLGATTDITRTMALGEVPYEIKRDFTLVLKAHLGLARAKFPDYVTGTNLDSLAKIHLWKEGADYGHGTGHGVGAFLSVHEGPERIVSSYNNVRLRAGMIISNEPGIYVAGKYGIRTENLVYVKDYKTTEFGKFFEFENLTLVPIDLNLTDESMLTSEEKAQLNAYHRRVYDEISPLLDEEHRAFLKNLTRQI